MNAPGRGVLAGPCPLIDTPIGIRAGTACRRAGRSVRSVRLRFLPERLPARTVSYGVGEKRYRARDWEGSKAS
ncbi:hypothetical protein FsymDg_1773 [Candidatus Protofrankia datiscae]|uniref:Uncharacterized protein n=1 Tax=Candidatus Protofrankia datiscae TaxID=2716812 RepID=F8B3H6_9ACTN|nr:hypothetical protein FsymDg_1773 [Candidatus Protofrankia datiscae]